jgi:YggT family protein
MLAYTRFMDALAGALFYVAVAAALLAAMDWAVRTRRISPFSPLARFSRAVLDPMIRPMERVVVRAGGLPASAPWWALGAVVVGGLLLLQLIGAMAMLLYQLDAALMRPTLLPWLIVRWALGLVTMALVVRVVSSWVRVSPFAWWVRWSYAATEWLLAPLRRVIPTFGPVDITPIVAWLLLAIVRAMLPG